MFTRNYIEALRWCAINMDSTSGAFTSDQLRNFIMTNLSSNDYRIAVATSYAQGASTYLTKFLSNLFYNAKLYVGYAANEAEMSDYSNHPTGIPTDNQGYSVNVTGEEGHKYLEHVIYHTYTNNTQNIVTMNKIVIVSVSPNYWHSVDSTGNVTNVTNQSIPLIIEEIKEPILMQPGETRRFNYKIKFPMFF